MSVFARLGAAARLSSRLRQPATRRFGSAAAQLDYNYYYCYDGDEDPQGKLNRRGMEESDGWETTGRGVQWVIIGDPMVRRHVYAERLANLLDVPHIFMGSLVRQELNPHSPLYKKIASAVNQGKLVPEDVIFGLLSKRLEEGYIRGETGFILDGIPRTRIQAGVHIVKIFQRTESFILIRKAKDSDILDQLADIDLVLNLKCKEDSVMKKTLDSGIYSPSQELHSMSPSRLNLSLQPQTGYVQSSCAESDAIWKEKLRMYAEQRKPVEEYYRKQKKLLDFQVAGAPGDTWEGLLAALQLQHVSAVASAANSSQKLTA